MTATDKPHPSEPLLNRIGEMQQSLDITLAEIRSMVRELKDAVEMAEDLAAYDAAKDRIAHGEPLVPGDVVHRIFVGETPVKAWREHRGLTQADLGRAAGMRASEVRAIETGDRNLTLKTARKLAFALDLEIERLLPPED